MPTSCAPTPRPSPARRWLLSLGAAAALTVSFAAKAEAPQVLPTIKLRAGMHNITAQVAQTDEQRQIGLMHRPSMPTNEGMLFAFPVASTQCFWMKNTLIPLSAAFIDDDGTVVNIEDMKPKTLNTHCSTRPVRFVLEMNVGWFAKRGIGPGYRLSGQPFTPPKLTK